jgi:predicted amino acid-binding ACT domain protein/uncharacterized protein (UPF0297 family)
VKGHEIRVMVQGTIVSSGSLATINVIGMEENTPVVKLHETPLPMNQVNNNNKTTDLQSEDQSDVSKAIEVINEKGITLSKSSIQNISDFMKDEVGTLDQKLETISVMAKKGLDFNTNQMKAVHEALHGENGALREFISNSPLEVSVDTSKKVFRKNHSKDTQEIIKQIRQALQESNIVKANKLAGNIETEVPENIRNALNKANQMSQENRQKILASVRLDFIRGQELASSIEQLINKGGNTQDIIDFLKREVSGKEFINLSKLDLNNVLKLEVTASNNLLGMMSGNNQSSIGIKEAIEAVKKEPSMQNLLNIINQKVVKSVDASDDVTKKIEKSINAAVEFANQGRELAARQELIQVLSEISENSITDVIDSSDMNSYELDSEFLQSLPLHSRNVIVSKITKKLSQMSIDFKEIKRDISKNLQNILIQVEMNKPRAIPQARPLLEATIKQLDQAILKSDMMLYTDMDTEKKLLKASSELALAAKLLGKGEITQASKIVNDVRNLIDKLVFKPSDTRMHHYVSKQLFNLEQPSLTSQISNTIESSIQSLKDSPSSRQMFEHIKAQGLTYESDLGRALVTSGKGQEVADASLKQALLKLAQSTDSQVLAQKAEQALIQMTGQQLLSKTDTSSLQSMMFSLPILLQDQVEQVKVYVNSKNDHQKVDWENCNLYFLLETKKLGDVGIMLSAVDRTLSVTLKNDKPDFKERIEPIAMKVTERLEEIGYRMGKMHFLKFSNDIQNEKNEPKSNKINLPIYTKKGYDFTV